MFSISQYDFNNKEHLQMLQQAFQLAYYIYPEKQVALRISLNAMKDLAEMYNSQDKRFYHKLKGWELDNNERKKYRTKIKMSSAQILQSLVYKHSEPYELWQEQQTAVDYETMVIRYLKQIISAAIKYHSFHAVVAISRVLHRYSNRETVMIYDLLAPNLAILDADDLARQCKRLKTKFIAQLKDRFNGTIQLTRVERDEERFLPVKSSPQLAQLVKEALTRLMPWGTGCVSSIEALQFQGQNHDDEHPLEWQRIHAVIHPACYARITAELSLAAPVECIEIPAFNNTSAHLNVSINRVTPPQLTMEMDRLAIQPESSSYPHKQTIARVNSRHQPLNCL